MGQGVPSPCSITLAESTVIARCIPHNPRSCCQDGWRCRDRTPAHLKQMSHPFDTDYSGSEPITLRGLFTWVDVDRSGTASTKELVGALRMLSAVAGHKLTASAIDWNLADEDGNGRVNFSEFSHWFEHHACLPLGVRELFDVGSAQDVRFLKSGSKEGTGTTKLSKKGSLLHAGEVPYPKYWKCHGAAKGVDFNRLVPCGKRDLYRFQNLFDETYSSVPTRDRKRHSGGDPRVPTRFQVVSAQRNENSRHWREYAIYREELRRDRPQRSYIEAKSATSWLAHGGDLAERLVPECNEWYLFHGTKASSTEAICRGDFRLDLAGGNTGTLYGCGTYCADSITKADEYATTTDEGLFEVLLVRALGGHVNYTTELKPKGDELRLTCIDGPFDSVLGDREAAANTYKEFVFYDSQNVFAEYIISYKRVW